jgi:YD repeat-containing protein
LIVKTNAFSRKLGLLASASCIGLVVHAPVQAQAVQMPQPPVNFAVDPRGIDLSSGQPTVGFAPLSIGDATSGLQLGFFWPGSQGFRHNYMITATIDSYDSSNNISHVTIADGQSSSGFTLSGSAYVPDKGDGATLVYGTTQWTFTDRNGTSIIFDRTNGPGFPYHQSLKGYYGDGIATTITRPNGFVIRLFYKTATYAYNGRITTAVIRLQSVTTSAGYQLKFNYKSNNLTQATADDWLFINQAQLINNAVDYCDPNADSCTGLTQSWPALSVSSTTSGSNTILSLTDPASRTRSFTFDGSGKLIGARRPSSSSDNVVYAYDGNNRVSNIAISGVGTWTYTFAPGTGTLTATVTTPTIPNNRVVVSDTNIRQPTSITDENGYTSTFTYWPAGLLKTATGAGAGSNYTTYAYDGRGNLTSTVTTPKSGSGLGTLTTSASYPASCTAAATCNKPDSTTDTAGKVINYHYNSNGTLDYVQSPAPTSGAARPEVHYGYGNVQAWLKNGSGSVVVQPDVVSVPTGTTTCVTGAWPCSAANQVVTALAYYGGPSATNFALQSTTVKSGSGSPSATTSYGYDNIGNVTSVTDPMNNVTPYYYDADRLSLGYRSPSLDGSSTSIRPAVVIHYNSDGLRDSISYGSVAPATSTFTARKVAYTGYDSAGRKTLDGLSDGTTTVAMTQYSYNGAGRLDCVAQRMNPANFGFLPVCTLGTAGSDGSDRITHYVWEYAGLLGYTQSAYSISGLQRNDVSYTHTLHGQVETMTDAKGNVTSYNYDGFDRLLRTCYNTALASCSDSAPDIVKLTYDSVGHLTNRGLRGHSC